MPTLVEIRPLELEKWHKQKGQTAFSQAKVIEVLYDTKTGGYATGLTEEEAVKYGKLLGVDLSDRFNHDEPHSFWSSKAGQIKLENATMLLDVDVPINFVRVKNMKASKFVANSMKEWLEGKFPDATHVIYDEHEALQDKATKIEGKRKAYDLLSKLTLEDKANVVRLLSDKTVRGRSASFIEVEIDAIIEEKAPEFIRLVQMGREEVSLRGTLFELLDRNILTKEGHTILYMGEPLASDFESTVKYFQDPNNTRIKITILERLEASNGLVKA